MKNSFENKENLIETDNSYDIISIIDENNNSIDCFIIDVLEDKNINYLLVVPCEYFEDEEIEAFILKQISEKNEDIVYIPITDDNEYNRILILFQENETDYEMRF